MKRKKIQEQPSHSTDSKTHEAHLNQSDNNKIYSTVLITNSTSIHTQHNNAFSELHTSFATFQGNKRKHKVNADKWYQKYQVIKQYKENPKMFSEEESKKLQTWMMNLNKCILTKDMELKWFKLGEFSGISDNTMIEFWKTDQKNEVCQRWKNAKLKWAKTLSTLQISFLRQEGVFSHEDMQQIIKKKGMEVPAQSKTITPEEKHTTNLNSTPPSTALKVSLECENDNITVYEFQKRVDMMLDSFIDSFSKTTNCPDVSFLEAVKTWVLHKEQLHKRAIIDNACGSTT